MTSVSILLAEHVARSRFEALPGPAIAAAKTSILDAIGVSLAASGLGEGCAAFIDLAKESGPGPSTVFGAGLKAQPLMAALANGAVCAGEPGPRGFAPNAYAAYIRDLDGTKIVAVCTKAE